MAGGLLWCTHWFHRALSGRGAHPVPCEMHSFAEYGITLAWIHPCRGSSDGKIFSCLLRGIAAWEGWEASFEKVLQKVHVLIYQIIQSQILASTKFKAKPKGTNRAFLSPDLQLSHAFANCQVNYLQRLSFKTNTEKIQTWVNNRAWALHTAILLWGMNWPPAKCIMQIYLHTAVLPQSADLHGIWVAPEVWYGSFQQWPCKFFMLRSWRIIILSTLIDGPAELIIY